MMENMVIKFTYKVHTKIYSKIDLSLTYLMIVNIVYFITLFFTNCSAILNHIYIPSAYYCVDLIKVEHTQKIKSYLMNKPQNLMTLIYFPVIKFNHTFMSCSYVAFSNMQ